MDLNHAAHYGQAPQETKSGSYIYSGSPSGHEWEFRTRIRVQFLKQKIRKKTLDFHVNKSASTSPERTRAEKSPVGTRGKSGRPHGEPSAWAGRPHLAGDPEEEDEEEQEEEEQEEDPDLDEFASPRALSYTNLVKEEQLAGEVGALQAELVQKVLEGLRGDAYLAAQDLGVERLMQEDGIDELIRALKRLTFPLQTLEAKELFRTGQSHLAHLPAKQVKASSAFCRGDVDGGDKSQSWIPPCRSLRA